jgi:hypothetical protein
MGRTRRGFLNFLLLCGRQGGDTKQGCKSKRVISRGTISVLPGRGRGSVLEYLSKEESMIVQAGPDLAKIMEDPACFLWIFQTIIAGLVFLGSS